MSSPCRSTVYPPSSTICPPISTADAPILPAGPGTGRNSLHLPVSRSNTYAAFVIASQVFFGPMPMNEYQPACFPVFALVTALFETGAGKGARWASSVGPASVRHMDNQAKVRRFRSGITTGRLHVRHCSRKHRIADRAFEDRIAEKLTLPAGPRSSDRPSPKNDLFQQSLPNSMNEVRVCGNIAGLTHIAGNLSAMIGGVQEDVRQNVPHQALVEFSLAVGVGNLCLQERRAIRRQKSFPGA